MDHWLVGGVLAALVGVLISLLNYKISLYVLQKKPELLSMMSIPRQLIHIIYLVIVYMVAPMMPWGLMELLVGAALGLTGAMFYFTQKLLKVTKSEGEKNNGGDENG